MQNGPQKSINFKKSLILGAFPQFPWGLLFCVFPTNPNDRDSFWGVQFLVFLFCWIGRGGSCFSGGLIRGGRAFISIFFCRRTKAHNTLWTYLVSQTWKLGPLIVEVPTPCTTVSPFKPIHCSSFNACLHHPNSSQGRKGRSIPLIPPGELGRPNDRKWSTWRQRHAIFFQKNVNIHWCRCFGWVARVTDPSPFYGGGCWNVADCFSKKKSTVLFAREGGHPLCGSSYVHIVSVIRHMRDHHMGCPLPSSGFDQFWNWPNPWCPKGTWPRLVQATMVVNILSERRENSTWDGRTQKMVVFLEQGCTGILVTRGSWGVDHPFHPHPCWVGRSDLPPQAFPYGHVLVPRQVRLDGLDCSDCTQVPVSALVLQLGFWEWPVGSPDAASSIPIMCLSATPCPAEFSMEYDEPLPAGWEAKLHPRCVHQRLLTIFHKQRRPLQVVV